jgi:hypothetical protein
MISPSPLSISAAVADLLAYLSNVFCKNDSEWDQSQSNHDTDDAHEPILVPKPINGQAQHEHAHPGTRTPTAIDNSRNRGCRLLSSLLLAQIGAASDIDNVVDAAQEETQESHSRCETNLCHIFEHESQEEGCD